MTRIEELEEELDTIIKPRPGFQDELNSVSQTAQEMVQYEHPAQWLFKQWLATQAAIAQGFSDFEMCSQFMGHLVGIAEVMKAGGFIRNADFYRVAKELNDISHKINALAFELSMLKLQAQDGTTNTVPDVGAWPFPTSDNETVH